MSELVAFELAPIFKDNMVIAAKKEIRVYGKAAHNSLVYARLNRIRSKNDDDAMLTEILSKGEVYPDEDNNFEIILPPVQYLRDLTLEVSNDEEMISISGIAAGEVIFAGGQSNMEFKMLNCAEYKEFECKEHHEDIRFYQVARATYHDRGYKKRLSKTKWIEADEKTIGNLSAVAYFTAYYLSRKLNVTVGVIECAFGGTSASCWIDRNLLVNDPRLSFYVNDYENNEACNAPIEVQIKEYNSFTMKQALWDYRAMKVRKENPGICEDKIIEVIGPNEYPGPMNLVSFSRPGGLYEAMFKSFGPFCVSSVIFYQGETDENNAKCYKELFTLLINNWRGYFRDDTLPFVFVQLPMYKLAADKDNHNWADIRSAQRAVSNKVDNTGQVIITELGQYNEIHPVRKREVGKRIADKLLFLSFDMLSESQANGPEIINAKESEDGKSVILSFANAENGFEVKSHEDDIVKGMKSSEEFMKTAYGAFNGDSRCFCFEAAMCDGIFVPVTAKIHNALIVLDVPDNMQNRVEYVRYLYYNYREVYIYGKNGIPLEPFSIMVDRNNL